MSSPPPLTSDVKKYFRNPNEVVKGLNPDAPSVYQGYLELVIPALKGKKVLDIGAGKGRLSVLLASRGCDVTAVDLSPEALAELEIYAKSKGVSVRSLQGDAESIVSPDESVDAVFCIETLVHVPSVTKALGEFNRVLKEGGILVTSVNMPLNFGAWLKLSGREKLIEPIYSSRAYQNHLRKVLGRPLRTSREIREREIVPVVSSSGFSILYKFVVLSRFLLIIAQKTGKSKGPAWLDGCPFLRLYPRKGPPRCMMPQCGRVLGAAHDHSRSSGICLCSDDARHNA